MYTCARTSIPFCTNEGVIIKTEKKKKKKKKKLQGALIFSYA